MIKKKFVNFTQFIFSSEKTQGKFDFLDGLRGSFALWVLIFHVSQNIDNFQKTDYYYFNLTGYFIGVVGFFILSSFLLTYRLLIEFHDENKSNQIPLITIKYFIRRFFRIYLPYIFYVFLIKSVSFIKLHGKLPYTSSWWSTITLDSTRWSHLWTIAPEIKYYLFIPIYVYVTFKAKHIKIIWILLLIGSIYSIEHFNLFKRIYSGKLVNFDVKNFGYLFLTRFTVFYWASILATIYYYFRQSNLFKYTENIHFKFIFGLISMILYIYGMILWSPLYNPSLKYSTYSLYTFQASVFWSIVMITMILGAPNFFTDLFNYSFFKYAGQFSFGIYLLHPMCIYYAKNICTKHKCKATFEFVIYSFILSYLAGFIFFYFLENLLMKLSKYCCSYLNKSSITV
jgi:peptidoglycan/LPS O-acetylase OafA/YrhL